MASLVGNSSSGFSIILLVNLCKRGKKTSVLKKIPIFYFACVSVLILEMNG